MRLISCHIENFGKLNDVSLAFDNPSGINMICEKNGWGKSTLAAFIKVMFFGFDNEGKRNNVENERLHYRPWQGGVYGGQLTFEAHDRTYIISRTFGAKEKDDEFVLRDAETRLVSNDFSANIGEELFLIDRASFLRSIYISQNDCVTAATDRINAKLGNLTDNTDDLNNYDTAIKRIADKLNYLSKTRKTGVVYKQNEQIAALKREIQSGKTLDASMEELMELKSRLHASYEVLKDEQKTLLEKQKKVNGYKDILVKKKEYGYLCQTADKKQAFLEEKTAFFKDDIPDAGKLDKYIRLESDIEGLRKNADLNKPDAEEVRELDGLEKRFAFGLPKCADIEVKKTEISDMQTLRWNIEKSMLTEDEESKLSRLNAMFSAGVPKLTEIERLTEAWDIRNEKKNAINSRNASGAKTSEKKFDAGVAAAVFIAVLLAVIGIALCFMMPYAGIAELAAEAAVLIVFAIIKKRSAMQNDAAARQKTAADEESIHEIEEEIRSFLSGYGIPCEEYSVKADLYRLMEDAKLYEKLTEKAHNSDADRLKKDYGSLMSGLEAFLQDYGFGKVSERVGGIYGIYGADVDARYMNELYKLENAISRYTTLKNKKERYEKAYIEYEENKNVLREFIKGLGIRPESDIHAQLQLIREALHDYTYAKSEYEAALKARNDFERQNDDMEAIKNTEIAEEDLSLADCEERLGEISGEIEKYHTGMASYNRQLDTLQEKRDEISDAERELEELQELCRANIKKLEILQKTQKYLEKAKISLTAKYTKPIKAGFDKYYDILCGADSEKYELDANLDISVLEQGMPRNTAFLSTGCQDMVGICMRMALIDAMYQDEKPFVVFDDPFVNLDSERTKDALSLLQIIAGEYQVVYFTCNESRCRLHAAPKH